MSSPVFILASHMPDFTLNKPKTQKCHRYKIKKERQRGREKEKERKKKRGRKEGREGGRGRR
jgi:hypothetical protein